MSDSEGSLQQQSRTGELGRVAGRPRNRITRRSLASRIGGSLILTATLAAATLPVQHAQAAMTDGTVTFRAKSADVGVGWTWGNGTLHWRGRNYPFAVKGLNVAAVGYSTVVAHGVVHNLKDLHDFDGTYASSTGEATVDKGILGEALRNGNGVEINISGSTKGARLSGSVDGIELTLNNR